ncbi:hypothetical protein GGI20_005254 [Coemansia sp. BCRC 34301]|nr:hypothetical protein GGI20_005254 [Coemansia sp. BCRC 34301]
MGKRKSSRKVVKKVQPKLETTFDCVFCNHEKSIAVSMDKKNKVGNLKCKICSATYQAALNHLSDPVDVYSEWIDACDEATRKETLGVRANAADDESSRGGRRQQETNAGNSRRQLNTNNAANRRPGTNVANEYSDEDDEEEYSDSGRRGYYDNNAGKRGDGRQRDANGVAEQLTDESDIDDF